MLAGFWLACMCLASPFDHLEKSITVLYRSLGTPPQIHNMLPLSGAQPFYKCLFWYFTYFLVFGT